MKSIIALLLPVCVLSMSAVAQTADENADAVKSEVDTQRCIPTRQLKSAVVVDDANILFFMIGTAVYRNQLPKACNGLLKYKTFSYERIAGRVCESDLINVHRNNNPGVWKRCRLGNFQSIDSREIPALIGSLHRQPQAESLPSADIEDVGEQAEETPPPE